MDAGGVVVRSRSDQHDDPPDDLGGHALEDDLDLLTWRAHEIDAFCNAWICAYLGQWELATTPEQVEICRREIEAWNLVRSVGVQTTYDEINRLLQRHGHRPG